MKTRKCRQRRMSLPEKKDYSGRKMRWDAILKRIPEDRQLVGAEVGVYMGDTATRILAARPNVSYILIDPWEPWIEEDAQGKPTLLGRIMGDRAEDIYKMVVSDCARYGGRAKILRMVSVEAAKKIPDNSLDFVFIDAAHTYEAVFEDIGLWIPKVRAGGWIGGHDYENLPRFPGVKKAVLEHFAENKIKLDVDCTWFHFVR